MKQTELKDLLNEAADPKCSWKRRTEIQCKLGEATAAMGQDGVYQIEGRVAELHSLFEALYVSTLSNRPELLPALFPTFALICGDREDGRLIASVDWSIVD